MPNPFQQNPVAAAPQHLGANSSTFFFGKKPAPSAANSFGATFNPLGTSQQQIRTGVHPALAAPGINFKALSMGTKAAAPGGLGTGQTNTIKSTYAGTEQKAGGDPSAVLAAMKKQLMGAQSTLSDMQLKQAGAPLPPSQTQTGQQTFSGASTQAPTSNPPVTGNQNSSPTPTFGGTMADLIKSTQSGSPTAPTYNQQTATYGAGNIPLGQQAENIGNQANQQIQKALGFGANAAIGDLTTGTQAVGGGNAQLASEAASQRAQAIAQGAQTALQGTGQALTGQSQAATASNAAAGQSLGQQQALQSGLTSAAGLAQPSGTYPFVFNPVTGEFTNAAGGGILSPTQIAQAIGSGQMSPEQGFQAGSYLGPTAQSQIAAAMQGINPNYNWNLGSATAAGQAAGAQAVAQAPGSTQAQNIQTSGTTQTGTAAGIYQQAASDYTNMTAFAKTAESQAQQVQGILSQTGLNSGIPDWNTAINRLSGKLGSTNVTALTTAVTELQNMYSQVLSSRGTTPTGSEQQALALLNPNSSASQISTAIDQLNSAMYNSLNAQYQKLQQSQTNLNSGGSGGSQSVSGFGWNG